MQLKSFIEVEVVWKDDDLLEIKVVACNGRYRGTTQVYDTRDSLRKFAQQLIGFPKSIDQIIHYEVGERTGYSFLGVKFYCIDRTGHTAVKVEMEENITMQSSTEKDMIRLEFHFEANDLIEFQKELQKIITKEEGRAILNGIEKYTYNRT